MAEQRRASQAPALAGDLSSTDPEVGLRAVSALRSLLEQIERLHVDNAREAGWSWADIARVMGVSKQSVHEKHAARRKALGKEP
jgi:DNA-directed RNA polymerase specialized sigma24 family protein